MFSVKKGESKVVVGYGIKFNGFESSNNIVLVFNTKQEAQKHVENYKSMMGMYMDNLIARKSDITDGDSKAAYSIRDLLEQDCQDVFQVSEKSWHKKNEEGKKIVYFVDTWGNEYDVVNEYSLYLPEVNALAATFLINCHRVDGSTFNFARLLGNYLWSPYGKGNEFVEASII